MKKIIIGISFLTALCGIQTAHAAITFDSSSSAQFGTAATTSASITIGAGSNEILFATFGSSGGISSTAAINGTPMTLLMNITGGGGSRQCTVLYALNQAGTVTVNATDTLAGGNIMGLVSFLGVNQTTPFDATSTNGTTTASTAVSNSITTSIANDMIYDVLGGRSTVSAAGSGQSIIISTTTNGGTAGPSLTESYKLSTASGTYAMSYTQINSNTWGDCLAALEPAPPPPTGIPDTVFFSVRNKLSCSGPFSVK